MNKTSQANAEKVISQINSMQDFLKFREELTRFLGELFYFMRRILPLMLDLNHSLENSRSEIPTASNRIDDVNRTTESATVAILDALDKIGGSLDELAGQDGDRQGMHLEIIHAEVAKIVNVLQFQDITSQKLTHANQILQAIHDRFLELFDFLETSRITALFGEELDTLKQDRKVSDQHKKGMQDFEAKTEDKIHHEQISQDDIDSMFI